MRKTLLLLALVAACSGSRESGWTEEELTPDALEWLMKHSEEAEASGFRRGGARRDGPLWGEWWKGGGTESGWAEARRACAPFASPTVHARRPGDAERIGPRPGVPNAEKKSGKKSTPRSWRRSTLAAHSAKLQVGVEEELPLEATHVSVRVDGFRARVVVDLYYRNNKDKQLHGMLKLRLPEGAVPDYTAFGIAAKVALPEGAPTSMPDLDKRNSSLKAARMVPRAKAARAFTETVRRKIDPALVEWSGAGIYTVRVFPLEPGKVHQIAIAYDVDLVPVGENLEYRLDLPEKSGDLIVVEINGKRYENPEQRTFLVTSREARQPRADLERPGTRSALLRPNRSRVAQRARPSCEYRNFPNRHFALQQSRQAQHLARSDDGRARTQPGHAARVPSRFLRRRHALVAEAETIRNTADRGRTVAAVRDARSSSRVRPIIGSGAWLPRMHRRRDGAISVPAERRLDHLG